MAVGAKGRQVLWQFLIEATLLSVIGGAIGVALGLIGADTIATRLQWPTRLSTNAIAVAFGFVAAIGITFGFYPAVRAARLDPIDALRVE
jgi:putative ABC transport system permease protein